MEIQLIRNATLKLCYAGTTFLIDPYFADKYSQPSFAGKSANPTVDLPLSIPEILEGVDYVLISHLHPDHFDTIAREVLPKEIKIFCQPSDFDTIKSFGFKAVEVIHESVKIGAITLIRTNGQHGSGEILNFMGQVSGFLFKNRADKTLYWSGDTIWYPEIAKLIEQHQPEVIVCHAGGNRFLKEFNIFGDHFQGDSDSLIMDKQQVMDLCRFASNSTIIATHLEALDHETITRQALKKFAKKQGINTEQLLIPEDGNKLYF